jgi:hypothetical protein
MTEENELCLCGCGMTPKWAGAKFVHGHHLRLKEFQRKPSSPIVNTCLHCNKEFISKKYHRLKATYCSQECVHAHDRTGAYLKCGFCETNFYVPKNLMKGSNKRLYCSNECRLSDWERKSLKNQSPNSYKRNAWKMFERKCADCGYEEHPEIILIHHIDGDRKNGLLTNLVPLCQNCHCLRHIAMRGNAKIPSSRRHSIPPS